MSSRIISILGCGWLGRPLGKALVSTGYVVNGSTTKNENAAAIRAAGLVPFILDVDRLLSHHTAHPFFNADVLIISLPHRTKAGKGEEYLRQIHTVMKAASDGDVRNIILISTTSVYPNLNRIVTEGDADVHDLIVQAENFVLASGIPGTILRFAGLFGPGRHPGRFLAGKKDIGGGNVPVNLIHLDDCIEIIKRVVQNDIWNQVFNACADDHPTRRTFYTAAATELGLELPVFSNDGDADFKIVSNERLKAALNYSFMHRLV